MGKYQAAALNKETTFSSSPPFSRASLLVLLWLAQPSWPASALPEQLFSPALPQVSAWQWAEPALPEQPQAPAWEVQLPVQAQFPALPPALL